MNRLVALLDPDPLSVANLVVHAIMVLVAPVVAIRSA